MAALSIQNLTYLDLAKQMAPDGSITDVAELLTELNPILEDIGWEEGNLTDGMVYTQRAGLPEPVFRKLYGFVVPTKAQTVQVTDRTAMMEDYSVIDKALAGLAKDKGKFMANENFAHIEGFNQKLARSLFYANAGTAPEEFTGLSPRYNTGVLADAANARNVIDGGAAGGQTDLASIWLVGWSPRTIFGIVPQNSKAGLQVNYLGEQTEQAVDGSGGLRQVLRTHYRWDVGLCVKDWRYAVRIANIDKSTLTKDAASGADLPDLMWQAIRRIPAGGAGTRLAFYMGRDILTKLGQQCINATKNSTLKAEEVGGKLVEKFHGIPVRQVDALEDDESAVSFS